MSIYSYKYNMGDDECDESITYEEDWLEDDPSQCCTIRATSKELNVDNSEIVLSSNANIGRIKSFFRADLKSLSFLNMLDWKNLCDMFQLCPGLESLTFDDVRLIAQTEVEEKRIFAEMKHMLISLPQVRCLNISIPQQSDMYSNDNLINVNKRIFCFLSRIGLETLDQVHLTCEWGQVCNVPIIELLGDLLRNVVTTLKQVFIGPEHEQIKLQINNKNPPKSSEIPVSLESVFASHQPFPLSWTRILSHQRFLVSLNMKVDHHAVWLAILTAVQNSSETIESLHLEGKPSSNINAGYAGTKQQTSVSKSRSSSSSSSLSTNHLNIALLSACNKLKSLKLNLMGFGILNVGRLPTQIQKLSMSLQLWVKHGDMIVKRLTRLINVTVLIPDFEDDETILEEFDIFEHSFFNYLVRMRNSELTVTVSSNKTRMNVANADKWFETQACAQLSLKPHVISFKLPQPPETEDEGLMEKCTMPNTPTQDQVRRKVNKSDPVSLYHYYDRFRSNLKQKLSYDVLPLSTPPCEERALSSTDCKQIRRAAKTVRPKIYDP